MIEAVNSVISNAQLARGPVDQAGTLNSFAADTQAVESVARGPVAPYISPYISLDTNFDTAVIQIRDSDTGDVLTQFPSEPTLQQRARQAAQQEQLQRPVQTQQPTQDTTSFESAALVAQQAPQVTTTGNPAQAQAAIAALSAGAKSGAGGAATVSVTA